MGNTTGIRARKSIRNLINSIPKLFMNKEIVINKHEVALFPKNFPSNTDFNSLLEEIKKETDAFNGLNIVIPTPPNIPDEFIRILLRSKDNSIGCNFSVEKVNIFWLNSRDDPKYNVKITEIQNFVEKILTVILRHASTIKRIGYIKEIYFESEKPSEEIKNQIVVEKIIYNLREFSFMLTYDLQLPNISAPCNDFVTITSGKKNNNQNQLILLSKDINTLPNEGLSFGVDEIKEFIKKAEAKQDKKQIYMSFFNGDE